MNPQLYIDPLRFDFECQSFFALKPERVVNLETAGPQSKAVSFRPSRRHRSSCAKASRECQIWPSSSLPRVHHHLKSPCPPHSRFFTILLICMSARYLRPRILLITCSVSTVSQLLIPITKESLSASERCSAFLD